MSLASLTTAEVARVLGVSEGRVRGFVRAGWCVPQRLGRRLVFRFQDLVVLRAAKSLHEARVPAVRVRRALRALARQLGEERTLSGLRISADGARVVVHQDGARFEPESGQLLLDFAVDALARQAAEVARSSSHSGSAARADPRAPLRAGSGRAEGGADSDKSLPASARALARRAFDQALGLEERDPGAAIRAYRRALSRDPGFVDAAVNLARLLHEAGRAKEAVSFYQAALVRSPEDPEIHYNLALALEDTAGPAAAIHHYQHALTLDPGFADAHWNLAGLLEAAGHKQEALRHYRAYEKLTR